jgi:hypothetical protein
MQLRRLDSASPSTVARTEQESSWSGESGQNELSIFLFEILYQSVNRMGAQKAS